MINMNMNWGGVLMKLGNLIQSGDFKGEKHVPVIEAPAKVKAGETISLVDLAEAVKADKERGKAAKTEKKPSIRAQLKAAKEQTPKKQAKQKTQDLERS